MIVHPFAALRATAESAATVGSVPYDVVDTAEARALAADNPRSFLHIIRAEIDAPEGTDPYSATIYERAARNLAAFRSAGHLVQEERPCLFAYRMSTEHHTQLGLLACCSIDEYEGGVIKKHELTRRDKEDDRTRHMVALRAQCGPVLVAYRDSQPVEALLQDVAQGPALLRCTSENGVLHEVWRLQNSDDMVAAFAGVSHAYVADGHHRSASAARARAECRTANPGHDGSEEYNFFLTALFPASQMNILAYNRVVADLNGHTSDDLLAQAEQRFRITPTSDPLPQRAHQLCAYVAGKWYLLEARPEHVDSSDPVASLDVSILHREVIEPLLGIADIRRDPRISFVGGSRGTSELQRRVDQAGDGIAFAMFPTSIEQLMAIADAGQIMPPKSTWFEPKLRSGLVLHAI